MGGSHVIDHVSDGLAANHIDGPPVESESIAKMFAEARVKL